MLTEKTTITLTKAHKSRAIEGSQSLFGKSNLSGYIQVLIQRDYEERKRRENKGNTGK